MSNGGLTGLLAILLLLLTVSTAGAGTGRCLAGEAESFASDAGQLRAVRDSIDARCVCADFDGSRGRNHRDYQRCAAGVVQDFVDAGELNRRCKATAKKYFGKSTCGRLPALHALPCVQRSLRTGAIKCTLRSSTRMDGTTPTNSCTDQPGRVERWSCAGHTRCIDAADTNGDLAIAGPGDTGSCVSLPTPTSTTGIVPTVPPASTPTPTPSPTNTEAPVPSATTTATPVPDCSAAAAEAAELDASRARWLASGVETYDLDYRLSCGCPSSGDATVLVTNGEVVSVLDSATGEEIHDPATGVAGFHSVDTVFDIIATAIDACVSGLVVEYDPGRGYPTSVLIDFVDGTTDDDVGLRIDALHVAAVPTFPIALGECLFDPECADQSCMPHVANVPNADGTSNWTAFSGPSNVSNIQSYIPVPCGGGMTQRVRVGDTISLTTGQVSPLLTVAECVVDSGHPVFTVPIVPCGEMLQFGEVMGFVEIGIDAVVTSGTPRGISLHGIWQD